MSPTPTEEDMDILLERYLKLLDGYTKLRASLTDFQSRIYQDLARANFAAERGMRYGRDLYDQRMQSSRRLVITGKPARFEVVDDVVEKVDETIEEKDVTEEDEGKEEKKKVDPRDPLRWFGILTPMALRQAQREAVEAVKDVLPRLVSVDAEMKDIEIRVRRARKRRAKAEAAGEKERVVV